LGRSAYWDDKLLVDAVGDDGTSSSLAMHLLHKESIATTPIYLS
jgi:hypothetical protein